MAAYSSISIHEVFSNSRFVLLILALTAVLLFLSFITQAIRNVYFHPLKKYPGPKLWAASSLPFILQDLIGNKATVLLELHKKYGSVVRISPNELSYSDNIWRDGWAHRQGHQEFSKVYSPPSLNGVWGILTANRENHARFRRLLAHSFSEKGLREQQSRIVSYIDALIRGLRKSAEDGPQDMVQWFNWTTFDLIGDLAFGESFGCLERGQTHPWIAAIFGNVKALVFIAAFRRLGFGRILPLLASKDATRQRQYNFDYSDEKIRKRVPKGTEQGDFLDGVLKHSGTEKGMTHGELVANASHLVLAGSETTATLLSGCIYQLLRNPEWLEKATMEVRTVFKSQEEMDLFSVSKLKYVLAVLDETMRIYPPVPTQASRIVPYPGDTVAGKYLPGGTQILLPQYVAYHLESNFKKPEEFHPERFLGDSEFASDNFGVMQPFSVGPRNCIGRNLAYAEMRLILAKVLWNFDLLLDERTGDWTGNQKTFILWEKSPLWVHVRPRG